MMFGSYTDELRNQTFDELIKDIVSDSLDKMTGMSVYGADIPSHILEEDNLNNSMFVYTQDNEDFIFDHKDESIRVADYIESLGLYVNPFNEPEKYAYFMEEMGLNELISKSNFIQENWNNKIVLDEKTIAKIKEELEINEVKIDMKEDKKIKQEEKLEAVTRMEYLGFHDDTINEFKDNDKALCSDQTTGELRDLTPEQMRFVKQFEKENNCTIYHCISGDYKFSDGTVFHFDNYLQANGYKDEWEYDREDLKSGWTFGYVNNTTNPQCSEFGSFGIAPRDGMLIRNDRGYDFEPMDANSLADKIDNFMKDFDPYEYADNEKYKGSNRDEIFHNVLHNDLKDTKKYLKDVAYEGNGYMKNEAKELISDIDKYSKNFEKCLEVSEIKVSKGMKM